MSRFVIIGGSGFLGETLSELILSQNANADIMVLDIAKPKNKNVKFFEQDLCKDFDFVFNADDIVVHLAARQYHLALPKKNRQEFFSEVNVLGTRKVLEQMLKCGAKNLVYFSTDMVYGFPKQVPVPVNHAQNPIGEYGLSKKLSEEICKEFRQKGMNITIFRPRMIAGKGRLGILVKLFKLIDHNLPLPMIGTGNNSYQMVSVNDCASAILCAVEKSFPNKEYNLGSKNPPKVKDLLRRLIKQSNSKSILIPTWGKAVKFTIFILSKLGLEIMYKEQYSIADINYLVSISETEKDLGWSPKYDDADMIVSAYAEYKQTHKADSQS